MARIPVTDIFDEASRIVAARLFAYDQVMVDLYFMAGLDGDYQTQSVIWQEAWSMGNTHLLLLLLLTEVPFLVGS